MRLHPTVFLCRPVRGRRGGRADGLDLAAGGGRFRAANPNLHAGELNIQESKAAEITAYLRPNPNLSLSLDQLQPFNGNPYRPLDLRTACYRVRLSARAAAQARTAPGKRTTGDGDGAVATAGPGTEPAVRPARRVCADPAGEGAAGQCKGEPGLLRQGTGDQPQPLPGRRYRARGPGPHCTAARAVRIGLPVARW